MCYLLRVNFILLLCLVPAPFAGVLFVCVFVVCYQQWSFPPSSVRDRTQDLMDARQTLYHLTTFPALLLYSLCCLETAALFV